MNDTKLIWTVILALSTTLANGSFWLLNRLQGIDEERQRLAVVLEQRCGRIEAKLDRLLAREPRGSGKAAKR